jgi:hypothetical protein
MIIVKTIIKNFQFLINNLQPTNLLFLFLILTIIINILMYYFINLFIIINYKFNFQNLFFLLPFKLILLGFDFLILYLFVNFGYSIYHQIIFKINYHIYFLLNLNLFY